MNLFGIPALAICLLATLTVQAKITINEVCSKNATTMEDENGNDPDWIELHNSSSAPIDLSNYYLSSDSTNLEEWQFPTVTIPANGFLLVFASGDDDFDVYPHTNFGISQFGEKLFLSDAGWLVDEVEAVSYTHLRAHETS